MPANAQDDEGSTQGDRTEPAGLQVCSTKLSIDLQLCGPRSRRGSSAVDGRFSWAGTQDCQYGLRGVEARSYSNRQLERLSLSPSDVWHSL